MKEKKLTLEELCKELPEAYEALPEPYKNDNVLDFIIEGTDLFALAKPEQKQVIGSQTFFFYENNWSAYP
jgi:hypothetical protein